jgi:alpha-glucoside transport system substrate-binding protein
MGNFVVDMWEQNIPALEGNLDARVGVFGLPPIDEQWGVPLVVDSGLVVMFNDRPEVRAYLEYLTTADSAEDWARAGGALFPHLDQDLKWYATGYERAQVELLMKAEVIRFDASDLMPPEVGRGSFWEGMANWVDGWAFDVVAYEIENSWPYDY